MATQAQLLPGTLDLLILRAVSLGPLHGYAVLLRIEQISGGALLIEQGALYPGLYRLERHGLLTTSWGISENNRRATAFRKLVAAPPPAGSNLVIVSHKPNILDAFGKDWFDIREGEASVFKPDGNGGYKLIVRVQANEWGKLAQASN